MKYLNWYPSLPSSSKSISAVTAAILLVLSSCNKNSSEDITSLSPIEYVEVPTLEYDTSCSRTLDDNTQATVIQSQSIKTATLAQEPYAIQETFTIVKPIIHKIFSKDGKDEEYITNKSHQLARYLNNISYSGDHLYSSNWSDAVCKVFPRLVQDSNGSDADMRWLLTAYHEQEIHNDLNLKTYKTRKEIVDSIKTGPSSTQENRLLIDILKRTYK